MNLKALLYWDGIKSHEGVLLVEPLVGERQQGAPAQTGKKSKNIIMVDEPNGNIK